MLDLVFHNFLTDSKVIHCIVVFRPITTCLGSLKPFSDMQNIAILNVFHIAIAIITVTCF